MTHFSISNFHGSSPRLAPHLIKPGHATRAVDCKLDRGMLDSWREPLLVHAVTGKKTVVRHECCWVEFDGCADVAYGAVNCKRLFVTGDEPYPVSITINPQTCAAETHRLGVPCPTSAPSCAPAIDLLSPQKGTEGRSYAYRYVNPHKETGGLSAGSTPVNVRDGQSVVVTGWAQPDPSWGVTHIQIFRTVSSLSTGSEQSNTPNTHWMLVGETAIGAAMFIDTKPNEKLIEVLEDDVSTPPPAELTGIVWVESMNVLAGFVGRRVYFSENNHYHHWHHYFDLDDNVRGLAESNGYLYVATDGAPYVIKSAANEPDAANRSIVKLPAHLPMIGYGNRQMGVLPSGALYPSDSGLVMLSQNAVPVVLTFALYTEDQWRLMEPQTAVVTVHSGRIYTFMAGGSFVLASPTGEQSWANSEHSELSDTDVLDAFVTRQGEFMLLKADGVYQWDRGEALRPHRWESSTWHLPQPANMGSGRLIASFDSENIKVEVDGRVALDRAVPSTRVFRLPMWAAGCQWKVTLTGTAQVSTISLASSMHELGV